ncbi:MAG: hypothetical protein AB7K71_25715, partial [Polyangiaceae bacterium]
MTSRTTLKCLLCLVSLSFATPAFAEDKRPPRQYEADKKPPPRDKQGRPEPRPRDDPDRSDARRPPDQ